MRVPDRPDRPWAVCVYCASSATDERLLSLAARVGEAIADRGWTLVSGGGNVSAMGALAHAARARGGRTVGVIPKALVHREVADVDADELVVTDTMRERKQVMEDRADAFLIEDVSGNRHVLKVFLAPVGGDDDGGKLAIGLAGGSIILRSGRSGKAESGSSEHGGADPCGTKCGEAVRHRTTPCCGWLESGCAGAFAF